MNGTLPRAGVAILAGVGLAIALVGGAAAPGGSTTVATVKGLTVLYSFQGAPDGAGPNGGVIVDEAGSIFGTTLGGGSASDGTVFALKRAGGAYRESIVHDFAGSDGAEPYAAPLADTVGDLFVTASMGGSNQDGSAIELSPQNGGYVETATFSFGLANGANPSASLLAQNGTLYTTTVDGGAYGYGAIVALTASGLKETDVYDFQNAPDGAYPQAGLIADASGALYGTTYYGGNGTCSHGNHLYYHCGTVFKFVPSAKGGGTETVLWTFQGGNNGDGADPNGGVILDEHGNIYGTTVFGGTGCGTNGFPPGCGTVFKLKRRGTRYEEHILHAFTGAPDGQYPYAGLIATGGVLYGTTAFGGQVSSKCSLGCGTIFGRASSGPSYTVSHRFAGNDGAQPLAPLFAKGAALYGTTSAGGRKACTCGEVFKFVP